MARRERRQRRQAGARDAQRHLDAAPQVVLPDGAAEVAGRDVAEGEDAGDGGDAGAAVFFLVSVGGWWGGEGRGRSLHEAEGEDAHEEFALAALGVQVAQDGDGEEDGDEVGGDVDAAEGDPDGAEVDAFAGGCVGEELLPEVGDGLADEGEG